MMGSTEVSKGFSERANVENQRKSGECGFWEAEGRRGGREMVHGHWCQMLLRICQVCGVSIGFTDGGVVHLA